MMNLNEKGIRALRRVLEETNYLFVMNTVRGVGSFQNPWYDFAAMRRTLENLHSPYRHTLSLLQMGIDAPRAALEAEIGKEALDGILQTGLWEERGGEICCRNLVVLTYQGLYVVTELNPWFENCQNRNTDVYIGSDSLRLAENISFRRGARVLDLCSGTGIQGLMAAKSAEKVVSVELNPKTVPVTRFNILLNREENRMDVREGNLYDVLREDETFDCIYANPPFIPMPDNVEYPICGGGGEDGLTVLRSIMAGLPRSLNRGGEAVIFCQCLGDETVVFFDREVQLLCETQGWRCTAARTERLNAGAQIEQVSELTALFQEPFDQDGFRRRMHEIYDCLGAKYLYSVLYRIENGGTPGFINVDTYNPWHTADRAAVAEDWGVVRRGGMDCVTLGGRMKRTVSEDVTELIRLLARGESVERAAKWLYVLYRKTLLGPKARYYAYLTSILSACRLLETDGILRRIPTA